MDNGENAVVKIAKLLRMRIRNWLGLNTLVCSYEKCIYHAKNDRCLMPLGWSCSVARHELPKDEKCN